MHNPNAVPSEPALFLVRNAIALEAAFQKMRQSTDTKVGNSYAFRKVFAEGIWHGQYSEQFQDCRGLPNVTLTPHQQQIRSRLVIGQAKASLAAAFAASADRAERRESYWVERFATISAANFVRRLGQPQQPLLTPSIADPEFRADFIRRHGLTGTLIHNTEHSA